MGLLILFMILLGVEGAGLHQNTQFCPIIAQVKSVRDYAYSEDIALQFVRSS